MINIIAFTGSLRKGSYNMATLINAKELIKEKANIEIIDISKLPLLNEDEEFPTPESVSDFRKKLNDSDGILIATPEYNYSIPPVLKNALDWASRGEEINNKPVAIISASPSILGGSRAQYQLRQIFVALNLNVINDPEVFITKANEKFDENGQLIDEYTRMSIVKLLTALIKEIEK